MKKKSYVIEMQSVCFYFFIFFIYNSYAKAANMRFTINYEQLVKSRDRNNRNAYIYIYI